MFQYQWVSIRNHTFSTFGSDRLEVTWQYRFLMIDVVILEFPLLLCQDLERIGFWMPRNRPKTKMTQTCVRESCFWFEWWLCLQSTELSFLVLKKKKSLSLRDDGKCSSKPLIDVFASILLSLKGFCSYFLDFHCYYLFLRDIFLNLIHFHILSVMSDH